MNDAFKFNAFFRSLYIPVVMMGVSFSLITANMRPFLACMVEDRRPGFACSLMALIRQVGPAGFNRAVGFADDSSRTGASNPIGCRGRAL